MKKIFLIAVSILALAVLSAPYIVSLPFGTKFLSNYLSKKLGADVELVDLKLDWFKHPFLGSLSYKNTKEHKVFLAKELSFKKPLFFALASGFKLPPLQIQTALVEDSLSEKKGGLFPFPSIEIQSCDLKVAFDCQIAFELKKTYLDYQLSKDFFSLRAKGQSLTSKQEGIFDLSLRGSLENKSMHLDLKATSFPSQMFDYILKTKDFAKTLLGTTLSCQGHVQFSDKELYCNLEASSATLKGSFHTKQEKNVVLLSKPSFISLSVDEKSFDKLFHKVPGMQNLTLINPGSFQLFIDDFKAPFDNHLFDLNLLSYQARLFSSSFNFKIKNTKKTLSLNATHLSSFSRGFLKEIQLSMKSSFNYNQKNPCYIASSCALINPLNDLHLAKLNANISKCPLLLFDELFETNNLLRNLLGEQLDIALESVGKENEQILELSVNSPSFELDKAAFALQNSTIALLKPITVAFQPLSYYQNGNLSLPYFKVEKMERFNIELSELKIDQANVWKEGLKNIEFKAAISCPQILFDSPFYLGACSLKNLLWSIDGTSKHKIKGFSSFSLKSLQEDSLQSLTFGENLDVNCAYALENLPLHGWNIPIIQLSGKNENISFNAEAKVSDHLEKLELIKPIDISFSPSPFLFNKLLHVSEKITSFSSKVPLGISIEFTPLGLKSSPFENLNFSLMASGGDLSIFDKIQGANFLLGGCNLKIVGSSKEESLLGNFSCTLSSSEKLSDGGKLLINYKNSSFSHKDVLEAPYDLSLEMDQCPVDFFDAAFGYNSALSILIGEKLSSNTLIHKIEDRYMITSDMNSPNLRAHFSVEKTADFITLKDKKIEGDLFLKEDSYSALEELLTPKEYSSQMFSLTREARIHFVIDKLKWALNHSEEKETKPLAEALFTIINTHLEKSFFSGKISLPDLSIYNRKTKQTVQLQNFSVDCSKKEGATPFIFDLFSKISHPQSKQGSILASLSFQNKKTEEGKLALHSKIDAKVSKFPSLLFDMGFGLSGLKSAPPSLFLGDEIDATLQASLKDLNGTLDFEVTSNACQGHLHGLISNNVLKLIEPIRAKIAITPALAEHFLANMNISLLSSSSPVELFIDSKGFYFPINPYSLDRFQIRSGKIDLGEITCKNKGNPEDIGGFFKLNLSSSTPVSLWFAPIDFSLSNATLHLDRTEVLYNRGYEIAFWGKILLGEQKVKMTLGLTEQSLQKALGIHGLPRSFVLQIPMEGPLNDVRVNKELATARIALLVAKTSGLTNYGGIWGGIASALNEFANDQTMVPPPKPPYPWHQHNKKSSENLHIIK